METTRATTCSRVSPKSSAKSGRAGPTVEDDRGLWECENWESPWLPCYIRDEREDEDYSDIDCFLQIAPILWIIRIIIAIPPILPLQLIFF